MPYNPSTSRAECNQHAGMVNQDSINNPRSTNNESYNTFDKSCIKLDTQLFDEIRACYMDTAESGDVKRIDIMQDLRSPVLKSPLLTPVHMHRSFFQVPWSVIMPNTWEYVYRNPVKGDDIVFEDVAPVIKYSDLFTFFKRCFSMVGSLSPTSSTYLDFLVRVIHLYYSVFGRGSLARQLKVRLPKCWSDDVGGIVSWTPASFDTDTEPSYGNLADPDNLIVLLCNMLAGEAVVYGDVSSTPVLMNIFGVEGGDYGAADHFYSFKDENGSVMQYNVKSVSDAFNFIREFILHSQPGSLVSLKPVSSRLSGASFAALVPTSVNNIASFEPATYNLMPLIAYQCAVAQFFTNDHVDSVYSAKMWQQNALSSVLYKFSDQFDGPQSSFSYNGIDVPYDAYSGAIVHYFANLDFSGGPLSTNVILILCYFQNLFIVGQSLRYGDYFTSMRVQPLAVGDVTAAVDDSKVSAVDVNRALWSQRLLNAINRTKQSIYDYMQSLTGVLPQRREPQPNFIITEDYRIGGMEVENTSDDQGNIVTLFRNSESKRVYDVYVDEPSFVIGVDYFSAAYCYPDAMMKIANMNDRFDWFNHFMQHIGDQSVNLGEIISSYLNGDSPIGYQLRYAQFKFSISDACGAFLLDEGQLDSWALLFEKDSQIITKIGSMFIRNHNADFDKFYSSLTSCNSGRYHFIKSIYFRDMTNSKQQAFPSLL